MAKRWQEKGGFGFITPDSEDGGAAEDIFVHRTDIIAACERPVLAPGQQVQYEYGTGRDGRPRALRLGPVCWRRGARTAS